MQLISTLEEFNGLDRDVEGSAKRWKKMAESECPEKEKLPQEWKNKSSLQKLIILRALRPDRMTYAIRFGFIPSNCFFFFCADFLCIQIKLLFATKERKNAYWIFYSRSYFHERELTLDSALLRSKHGLW